LTNNSRFLILPNWHYPNLASRILSLCHKRLCRDWQERFGHPVLLIETFVDPKYFQGTVYRASNWVYVGDTKGFPSTTLSDWRTQNHVERQTNASITGLLSSNP
jgi:Domain of unknown function (DUF4338)